MRVVSDLLRVGEKFVVEVVGRNCFVMFYHDVLNKSGASNVSKWIGFCHGLKLTGGRNLSTENGLKRHFC